MADMPIDECLRTSGRRDSRFNREVLLQTSQSTNIENINEDYGMRFVNDQNRDMVPEPIIVYLLAKVDALESRCMTLENIVASTTSTPLSVQHNIPVTSVHTLSFASAPTQLQLQLLATTFDPAHEPNVNNFQWMHPGVGHTVNVAVDSRNMQLSPHPVMANQPIAGINQSTFDEDLGNWADLEALPYPSVPSLFRASYAGNKCAESGTFWERLRCYFEANGYCRKSSSPLLHCHTCMKSFSRAADLRRHSRSHNPNAQRFSCPGLGCGFQCLRKDKLNDHRAQKQH